MESRYIATVTYAFKENDMEKNSTAVYFANLISFEMQDALATRITFLEQKNHE